MKKIYTLLGLWFLATGLWAQQDDGAKIGPVSQAIQKDGYTVQVGLPFLGQNLGTPDRITDPLDVRFPWDILYLYDTFAEESFNVSKGYFGDKILLNWSLRNNIELVSNIKIYRREYGTTSYNFISNVAPNATEYEDQYVEGGVLYEYKIVADGVSEIEQLYNTFITGIGYRSPTAVITGNISFKGGNPVKDVIIKASPQGNTINIGSALYIPGTGMVEINSVNKQITAATTLQAWMRPKTDYIDNLGTAVQLFRLESSSHPIGDTNSVKVEVKLLAASNMLKINIGGSEYNLHNYYPSGNLNSRGDDILVPVVDFNNNYVHFSVVIENEKVPLLYINGRVIDQTYRDTVHEQLVDTDINYAAPYFEVSLPTQVNSLKIGGSEANWDNIYLGGGKDCYIDEIRVWNIAKEAKNIRTDFKRYINGNNSNLVTYLTANEGIGEYAYDLSRNGFNYNKNHGKLWNNHTNEIDKVVWVSGSGNIPTADQLGILGVSDSNGNYEITSIPYSGTGESFTITPLFGQHQFEPSQQLVFLGQGSEVVNKVDFVDISSFSFKGKVVFDSRGVFPSFVDVNGGGFNNLTDGDQYISGPGILDESYNYYQKGSEKYNKGEYWYNDAGTANDDTDDYLERYARIAVEEAHIYIDGDIVLDENNFPVTSDSEGNFEISVPIGNHFITIKKDGHEFGYNGRFPAEPGTFKEFFEDANEQVIFVDNTRVTLVGKVVGGAVEAQKPIGFGHNGMYETVFTNSEGIDETIRISAKNNIGIANITLDFAPAKGSVTSYTKFNFETNSKTGEYRVSLLPLNYEIETTGLKITSNLDISLLDASESVNISEIVETSVPEYTYQDETVEQGEPYHYEKSFTYRAVPVLRVIDQVSDKEVMFDDRIINTNGFKYPIYSQFKTYKIVLNSFERYINSDDIEKEDIVPVIDGQLNITNNLALPDSETIAFDQNDASIINYTFKGGFPKTSPPFTRNINIQYRVNDVDYEAENYITEGIILGGKDDGERTFVTSAPDIPDIILRDPPGSNSFASIEKGESISFTSENSFVHSEGVAFTAKIMRGVEFRTGGGLVGPVVTTETTNNVEIGIGTNVSSDNGESLTKTYNFSQTISTSDDPDWVGADADLYIGNSKNHFYSSFDNVQISDVEIGSPNDNFKLVNSFDESIFISKQKGLSMVEEPTNTFFVYSQRHIMETLIPEYELFIFNIENGLLTSGVDGVLEVSQYKEQIRLWKKLILDNEISKYLALNDRKKYKETLNHVINNFNQEIEIAIAGSDDPLGEFNLIKELEESNRIEETLKEHFEDNISFDAGVGEVSRGVETIIIAGTSTEYNITVDESIVGQFGFNINTTGILSTTTGLFQQEINTSLSEDYEKNTVISYTLKDNDEANLLSVDVINNFDGHGPIFSTLGGRTSCPYEGSLTSKFFSKEKFEEYSSLYFLVKEQLASNKKALIANQSEYNKLIKIHSPPEFDISSDIDENREKYNELTSLREVLLRGQRTFVDNFLKDIDCCSETEKALLSFATQRVEVPLLSAKVASLTNVPEGKNAEFDLILENNSASETDADFLLIVDNTTNPNNALINIEQNGTIVRVPYGEAITYTMTMGKSISDVYDYKDIRVVLQSLCDGDDVSSDVSISAQFVPSCSEVVVDAPLDNWVYNIDTAYNLDGTTNPLKIDLTGFNTSFNSFQKIDLEYRLSTSPNWKRIQTYYSTQEFYDEAVLANETEISLISDTTLSFGLDIAGLQLQDGEYEIRARSSCTNDTEFISDVITGRVDLSAPQRFGTPEPIDGILSAGEDLKVSFNEFVFYNSAVSNIEIKGATNQLPINNNVSLYFEGTNNTAVINDPSITSGDFTIEFWMNNSTTASAATIIGQNEGLRIGLDNGEVYFTLAGVTARGVLSNDNLFHHYTFTHKNSTGEISIYEEDKEIAGTTGSSNLQFTNTNELVIGGNSFVGNIHYVRLWNKTISLENAYATRFDKLIGNESNLIGYWPMNEGRGEVAKDLARFKHAVVNASWDIKPKGNSYEFASEQFLEMDHVDFVQLTSEMDATVSFWIKTDTAQEATLFSNGRGDGSDNVQSNGFANKWAINMLNTGLITFENEGNSYPLTTQSIADDSWHHITLLFNRIGSLRTYVDAELVSSNPMSAIEGFSGNKIWLGARGSIDLSGVETVDRRFTGKIDEFRFWNTLRNVEQIRRDQFNEVDFESIGLLLYARMNAPDPETANGPRYYHAYNNQTIIPSNSLLSNGTVNYSNDTPAIQPERELIKFQVNRVINEGDMILEPVVTDWASLEGQILDITVHRMFDSANNMQQSPITWTAFINRNEVSWYAEGYHEVVDIIKDNGESTSFEITLLNKGGNEQPFTIANTPNWLSLSSSSGTIAPDSNVVITATIDETLSPGDYLEDLYLQTEFGFDQKLQVALKVLAPEPDWDVNPNDFDYSMNIVGKVKIDGVFSSDSYDKIGAFYNDEVRGSVNLVYDSSYQEYFAYLSVYSNTVFGEEIEFSIWDASQGKIVEASIDTNATITFKENEVVGTVSTPVIFENTDVIMQEINMNQGWTWVSLHVDDPNFSDIDTLTEDLDLETSDRMLSHSPSLLETFYKDASIPTNSSWSGTISTNGGVTSSKMYKVHFANEQSLKIKGNPVDIDVWEFPIQENWNWLPYPISRNQSINEALAYFETNDGDVIKSQNLFAIYDPINGWKGTLNSLEAGVGYMIKSNRAQVFKYPTHLGKSFNKKHENKMAKSNTKITQEFTKYAHNMNAVVALPDGYDKLFVYDTNGVLKGEANTQVIGDIKLSFITIYGNTPEALVFYIGDGSSNKSTSKTFSFKSNEVLGTIANPVILEELTNAITIFPNPFDKDLIVNVNASKSQTVTIRLYTMTGSLIYSKEIDAIPGMNTVNITPNVSAGIYFIQIGMNQNMVTRKIIKK